MMLVIPILNYLLVAWICTVLLLKPLPVFIRLGMGIYLTVLALWLGSSIGQLVTPIFLLSLFLYLALVNKSGCPDLILFQLSWLWFVVTDYVVSIPMNLLGYSAEAIQTVPSLLLIYFSLHALLALLPLLLFKRLAANILNKFPSVPLRIQRVLLIEVTICTCVFLLNIIFGSLFHYSNGLLLFNGILFLLFTLSNIVLFNLLYRIMQNNSLLELKAKEQQNLYEYTEKLESIYQNFRSFKHDYLNLLSTMNFYIKERNTEDLQTFFEEQILPSSQLLTSQDTLITRLGNMKILEIKGILYAKLIRSINEHLDITLELQEPVTSLPMNLLDLSKIIGIFMDNAIEAACETTEKYLRIAIILTKECTLFHIENSSPNLPCPLERLTENGYSTKKENHCGLGLFEVSEILRHSENAFLSTSFHQNHFIQRLEIFN